MATPFIEAEVIYSASATVVTGSINLGADAGRSVEVVVTCPDGVTISEARITGGAILTQRSTGLFGTGNYARRYVFADVVTETGAQTITLTSSGSGLKYGYVVSRSGVSSIRGAVSGSNNTAPDDQPSLVATTVAGDTVSLIGHDFERSGAYTPGGGATERMDDNSAYVQDQIAGGVSTTASGTKAVAGTWVAGVTVLVPIAAPGPTLTTPTKSDTATTATGGFTTDGADGTARMVWIESSTQPSAPNATQVKTGQNAAGTTVGVVAPAALTITSAGAKSFAAATVNTQKTHWGFAVHTNAGSVDSNVLALGAVYPGTWRSVADVSTAGWSVTGAATHAAAINEDAPGSSAEFIVSPGLTSTPATHTTDLDKTLPAGSYNEQITVSVSSGTALLNVAYLNSDGTVQGTSADQVVTTTPTTFTLPVTTTGAATRKRFSVRTP